MHGTRRPAARTASLGIDPLDLFGHETRIHTTACSPLVLLRRARVLRVVFVALRLVNDSRTGRAWRSLREDPLAAEMMGMPVNRLKLIAFAFGAGVAGSPGRSSRRSTRRVFPTDFDFAAPDHRLHDGHPRRRRAAMAGVVIGARS